MKSKEIDLTNSFFFRDQKDLQRRGYQKTSLDFYLVNTEISLNEIKSD